MAFMNTWTEYFTPSNTNTIETTMPSIAGLSINDEAVASWRVSLQNPEDRAQKPQVKKPLLEAKTLYAVDASGSTMGRIMSLQQSFATTLSMKNSADTTTVMWGTTCSSVQPLSETNWNENKGGTEPAILLRKDHKPAHGSWYASGNKDKGGAIVDHLRTCDVWWLLTDGECGDVSEMTNGLVECCLTGIPVVFVVTSRRYGAKTSPREVNISVGVGAFALASDAMILFKDEATGEVFVMAAKGVFDVLLDGASEVDMTSWETLKRFEGDEALMGDLVKSDIKVIVAEDRMDMAMGAMTLGTKWEEKQQCMVDVDLLLKETSLSQEVLIDLLEPDAFEQLLLLCKTRGKTTELRSFLSNYKEAQQFIKREDIAGAGEIVEQLQKGKQNNMSEEKLKELQHALREAHKKNSDHYQAAVDDAKAQTSPAAPLINRALADLTIMEKSSYSANILDRRSNRAMRATTLTSAEPEAMTEELELTDTIDAYRSDCSICCGDEEIMSIALKAPADPSANTTDYALNFPLDAGASENNSNVLSAQFICFSCALVVSQQYENRGSIYNERIVAVIPTVSHVGINKKYMNKCFALALSGGLQTGQSGLSQLFMSILHSALGEKTWLKPEDDTNDHEATKRRNGLLWMLNNMLTKVKCRQTFDETGPWTTLDKAIQWAVEDSFNDEKMYSFLIRYPISGFLTMLHFHQLARPSYKTSNEVLVLKLLYEIGATCMTKLGQSGGMQPMRSFVLKNVYNQLNCDIVPRYLGPDHTVITNPEIVWKNLTTWFKNKKMKRLMDSIQNPENLLLPIQVISFSLATETQHQTPKGFFQRKATRDVVFSTAITKPLDVPREMATSPFMAFFPTKADTLIDHTLHSVENVKPFATAYGPSVLHCSLPSCNVRFDDNDADVETVRTNRGKHLREVYATSEYNFKNEAGMPEQTGWLKRPTSMNVNLYANIVRRWAHQPVEARRKIISEVENGSRVGEQLEQNGHNGRDEFVEEVVKAIVIVDGRGNIYQDGLEEQVEWLMPSFVKRVKQAADMAESGDVVWFQHVLGEKNTLESRIELERQVVEMDGRGKVVE